jgi:hypothetical protein
MSPTANVTRPGAASSHMLLVVVVFITHMQTCCSLINDGGHWVSEGPMRVARRERAVDHCSVSKRCTYREPPRATAQRAAAAAGPRQRLST